MAWVQKRVRQGQTRWVARWRDAQGTERSATFERRGEAVQHGALAEAEAKAKTRRHVRERLTVAQWLDRWLDTVVAPRVAAGDLAATTAEGYEQRVRAHIRPRLGHFWLDDLRVSDVDDLMTATLASGLSPRTARGLRATLSKALADAVRRDLVDRNVAKAATPPPVPSTEPSAFTRQEAMAILTALEGHPQQRLFHFMLLTGMRTSEALGLRWSDVDLDAGTFKIARTIHRISHMAARVVPATGLVEGTGKSNASTRTTPLSEAATALLREHKVDQARQRLAAEAWMDPDLIWASDHGTILDDSNVRRLFHSALAEAGVDLTGPDGRGRRLHELRRTFATMLLADGVPVHVVQRLGRWASPQVLLTSYAGTADDQLREAATRLADGLA